MYAPLPSYKGFRRLRTFTDYPFPRSSPTDVLTHALPACFVKSHPDAAAWLPGNRIHESSFVRLVVQEVYWIGGFGDRAYIGWIPVEEWKSVTREEIEGCRLPGEKDKDSGGWRNWLGLGTGRGEGEDGVLSGDVQGVEGGIEL